MIKESTDAELIAILKQQKAITQGFRDNKEYGFDMPLDSFILRCRYLNTQQWGLRIQSRVCRDWNYTHTPSSMDRGDFKTVMGESVEFKCSFVDDFQQNINVKQIRLWQKLKFYYILTIDFTELENLKYKLYKLTKNEMIEECKILKAGSCHMTKDNSSENLKVELGFSIKLGSDHHNRWEEKYLLEDFDIRALDNERLERDRKEKELQDRLDILERKVHSFDVQECIDSQDDFTPILHTEDLSLAEEVIETIKEISKNQVQLPVEVLKTMNDNMAYLLEPVELIAPAKPKPAKAKAVKKDPAVYKPGMLHNQREFNLPAGKIPQNWYLDILDGLPAFKAGATKFAFGRDISVTVHRFENCYVFTTAGSGSRLHIFKDKDVIYTDAQVNFLNNLFLPFTYITEQEFNDSKKQAS